jgi:formylglycine-generating enzyme required for sulfatase activity
MLFGKRNAPQVQKEEQPEDRVRLKPLLGFRPGVYLTALYGLIVLAALFFALVLPGLRNPGALLAVESEPEGAAVRVDGIYMDAAPCRVFVPRGAHTITVALPGFVPVDQDLDAPARVFGSAFFPKKIPLRVRLEPADPARAFADAAAEMAGWAFTGEPTQAYQIPLTLSEAAYRLGPHFNAANLPEIEGLWAALARFTASKPALRDLLRARFLTESRGAPLSPLGAAAALQGLARYLDANPKAALALADLLPAESAARQTLRASAWYAQAEKAVDAAAERAPSASAGTLRVGALTYREIPAGQFDSRNLPAPARMGRFYLAQSPLPPAAWEAFTHSNPDWDKANARALIERGLADSGYGEEVDLYGMPEGAVTGISWHAARAWCAWQTANLPAALAGFECRLPGEAEWEYAAAGAAGAAGLSRIGDFWEWCEDPFAFHGGLAAPPGAIAAVGSPERALRGGSWYNGGAITIDARGSLPPDSCSPFVSFRPVLAPRADNGAARE